MVALRTVTPAAAAGAFGSDGMALERGRVYIQLGSADAEGHVRLLQTSSAQMQQGRASAHTVVPLRTWLRSMAQERQLGAPEKQPAAAAGTTSAAATDDGAATKRATAIAPLVQPPMPLPPPASPPPISPPVQRRHNDMDALFLEMRSSPAAVGASGTPASTRDGPPAAAAETATRDRSLLALAEVVASEESYFADINAVLQVFLLPLKQEPALLSPEEHRAVFLNCAELVSVSRMLLEDFQRSGSDVARAAGSGAPLLLEDDDRLRQVPRVLLRHTDYLRAHERFCQAQARSASVLAALRAQRPTLHVWLTRRELSEPRCRGLRLADMLLTPVQRVARLPLLMDAVAAHAHEDTPCRLAAVEAARVSRQYLLHMNEAARLHSGRLRAQHLSEVLPLSCPELADWAAAGEHIVLAEGVMRLIGGGGGARRRHPPAVFVALFEDALIIARASRPRSAFAGLGRSNGHGTGGAGAGGSGGGSGGATANVSLSVGGGSHAGSTSLLGGSAGLNTTVGSNTTFMSLASHLRDGPAAGPAAENRVRLPPPPAMEAPVNWATAAGAATATAAAAASTGAAAPGLAGELLQGEGRAASEADGRPSHGHHGGGSAAPFGSVDLFESRLSEGKMRPVLCASLSHIVVAASAPDAPVLEITDLSDNAHVLYLDVGSVDKRQAWEQQLRAQSSQHGCWRARRRAITDVAEHEGLARLACARVQSARGRRVASVEETLGPDFARHFALANKSRSMHDTTLLSTTLEDTASGWVFEDHRLASERSTSSPALASPRPWSGLVEPTVRTPVVSTPYRATPRSQVRRDGGRGGGKQGDKRGHL